ncbi:AAA family ATPase [Sutcliffiella horikoshii]|uniref:AAA family ATPase n=1 Tax=Sutcliffiella horikoshii TaxID=79883 RepID=UPI003CF91EA0
MEFIVKEPGFYPSSEDTVEEAIYIIKDNWNDWFDYQTLYRVIYKDKNVIKEIGEVKIGEVGMEPDEKQYVSPNLTESFKKLDDQFFSLGQDVSYYKNLNKLGEDLRFEILVKLRDVALNNKLFDFFLNEDVMGRSLLRSVSRLSVRGQFNRLAKGDSSLTPYKFSYLPPDGNSELAFEVKPNSHPPSNVHVLIGRNGVGKTHMLNNMIKSLVLYDTSDKYGSFYSEIEDEQEIFASLVSISFSAFDQTKPLPQQKDNSKGIKYSYVGLQQQLQTDEEIINEETINDKEGEQHFPKDINMLGDEFSTSLSAVIRASKKTRLIMALRTLEADPIFKDIGISHIVHKKNIRKARRIFRNLSSGHKIVLLTITKLVETVEERTLVIIDEPEGHLHPPLLSAFTRALSNLLKTRNGVGIIATHSPVILQEVPKSCVNIINRRNKDISINPPEIETFGENIGTLTREVFGLEVTQSGFHKLLEEAVEDLEDFDSVIEHFKDELGMEARGIIRALLLYRDDEGMLD